ncbi:Uncharacterised protein [Streptococcus pneumoniae]|nr:Uncharacterised protein [Streptococcus pneumoniae]
MAIIKKIVVLYGGLSEERERCQKILQRRLVKVY